jgi:hypothetical protein
MFGFPRMSSVAAAVRACALAHSQTLFDTGCGIPCISGPSFFTTAVAQAVGAHPLAARKSRVLGGHGVSPRTRSRRAASRNQCFQVTNRTVCHRGGLRLLSQDLFNFGRPWDGVQPYTTHQPLQLEGIRKATSCFSFMRDRRAFVYPEDKVWAPGNWCTNHC